MDKNKNIRSEKSSSIQSAENALNEYKKRIAEVVHVAISATNYLRIPSLSVSGRNRHSHRKL